jgi:hypothetical protein
MGVVMNVGSRSPWGIVDIVTKFDDGVEFISTASHGGFKLDRAHNSKIMPEMRKSGGWYEEDCEYSIVALTFPELFTRDDVEKAKKVFCDWYPRQYAKMFNEDIENLRGKSYTYDLECFNLENRNNWIVISAARQGDFVLCHAKLGGNRNNSELLGNRNNSETAVFHIPKNEYECGRFGFVVDLNKYERK